MALRPDPRPVAVDEALFAGDNRGASLFAILKGVSRSFYLSMQVLPERVRGPIALGYLVARAADTIADTDAVPGAERRALLALLRAGVLGEREPAAVQAALDAAGAAAGEASPDERRLLGRVADCLALLRRQDQVDLQHLTRVLLQLIHGMDTDLQRFPSGPPVAPPDVVALPDQDALEDYTYHAAGCVGEFWTQVTAAHVPAVRHLLEPALLTRSVALGKCLQMVNVVRDVAADLRQGRCYWPRQLLDQEGLQPAQLAAWAQGQRPDDAQAAALRLVTRRLVKQAQDLAAESWGYVQAIPAREVRLRLACVWPLLLGLRTLEEIGRRGSPLLHQAPIKIRRPQVYALVAQSSLAALADAAAGRDQHGLMDIVESEFALAARHAQA